MSTFAVDETHILSTGRLKDVRLLPSFRISGEKRDPGPLHDLALHLLIRTPDLVIEDVEVEINTVPRADCRKLEQSMAGAIGLAIKGGFTFKVKGTVGGKSGCTHLVHLLVTMAPAVLQGYWALLDRRESVPTDEARRRAALSAKFLKDSCYTWREDGEAYRGLISIAEGAN